MIQAILLTKKREMELIMNVIVGVADMKVSNDSDSIVVTYSLGSCIGIGVYDETARVGGIAHFMLPESKLDLTKAKKNPYMFADTCIPRLFKSMYQLGATKQRMRVIVVGGAQILDSKGFFNIGKRNCMAVKKIFWKNNVMISYKNVEGTVNRTLKLTIKNGQFSLKTSGGKEVEI